MNVSHYSNQHEFGLVNWSYDFDINLVVIEEEAQEKVQVVMGVDVTALQDTTKEYRHSLANGKRVRAIKLTGSD